MLQLLLVTHCWPVIKDMLFRPCFWDTFFGRKTLFFRVRVLCQNNPLFGNVFFAENLGEGRGEGGGGEEFWDALLLRGGLNLTCVAARPKGPQRRKSRGKGRDPPGQKHAAGELGSLLVTIVGHLSSRQARSKRPCTRSCSLFFRHCPMPMEKRYSWTAPVRPRHMAAARFASGTGAGCFRLKTICASAVCHKRKLVQLAV